MKILKFIIIVFSTVLFNACKDGAQGDPGPKGPTGNNGKNGAPNTQIGPTGEKGPSGNQGSTGPSGSTGATGDKGIANLSISEWKLATWNYLYSDGGRRYFLAEIPYEELSKEAINNSIIYTQYNSSLEIPWELQPGISITIGGRKLEFHAVKEGKAQFKISNTYSSEESNDNIISTLNKLKIELRLVIIKGTNKL